jgi:hypothetical protein
MLMPFGKYKGQDLDAVPDEYLLWMSANVPLREPLWSAITDELVLRGYEELSPPPAHPRAPSSNPVRRRKVVRGPWVAIRKRLSREIFRSRPASATRPKSFHMITASEIPGRVVLIL